MGDGAIFSIGHSTLALDRFIGLLKQHRIGVVVDVRSVPFSGFNPQYNRDSLAQSLAEHGMKYAHFGNELGGRADGGLTYSELAAQPEFKGALARLLRGAADHRIALVCAEKEPLNCHRTILVSHELFGLGHEVQHIHHDGRLEAHTAVLERLLDVTGLPRTDLFRTKAELFAEAIEKQRSRMSHRKGNTSS